MMTAEERMERRAGQLLSRVCVLEAALEQRATELEQRDLQLADLKRELQKLRPKTQRTRSGNRTGR